MLNESERRRCYRLSPGTLLFLPLGDLDLPEIGKRYTSSREKEEVDAQMCPRGNAMESRTHKVGECEVCKKERGVLREGMSKLDMYDMEIFCIPEGSEKTIDIRRDRR